jgi:hypothetical protein
MADLVTQWATKLAQATAPDEIFLAPAIASAYLEGGEKRAVLFKQEDTNLAGAFGPGTVAALLPWILRGIVTASTWFSELLTSDEFGKALTVVKDTVELSEKFKPEDDKATSPQAAIEALPDVAPYTSLKRIMDVMGAELRSAGIPEDQADLITFRVLNSLLEEPQSANQFVQQLQEAT